MKRLLLRPQAHSGPRHLRWLGLLLSVLLLSCGGGQDHAGVGTGGTGLKEGNVSGFGSVFIDGVRYDDSQAQVQVDDGSGTAVPGQLKLGQRVRARINAAGQLTLAEILPALVGTVDRAPDAQGYLMVMGQWVRFVSKALPYQATLSSSTYLGGYSSLSDIAAGDVVEVHGAWFGNDTLKGQVLVASRIEQRLDAPAHMLVSGNVSAANGNTQSFRVSAADGRQVVGTGSVTAVGEWVRVWVEAAQVPSWNVGTDLNANTWSTASLMTSPAPRGASVEISGLPEQFDPQANRVKIQGVSVRLLPGSLSMATRAALQAGTFSRFILRLDTQTGEWTALEITPREGDSLGGITALVVRGRGNAAIGADGVAQLHGVDVHVSDTVLEESGCLAPDADADTTTVQLTGTPEGAVVQAITLDCTMQHPP